MGQNRSSVRSAIHVRSRGYTGRELDVAGTSLLSHKRKFALPKDVEHRSLTTLREKLIKIGAKVVRHGRYITFQLAEAAVSRTLFAEILHRINRLRPAPLPP